MVVSGEQRRTQPYIYMYPFPPDQSPLPSRLAHNTEHSAICYTIGHVGLLEENQFSSVQFSSVTQSSLTLCDPMDCSMPDLPVHHQLPEPTQTHVNRVGDATQPSYHLLSSSPPAFNLSKDQARSQ